MSNSLRHLLRPFEGLLSDSGTTDIVVNRPGEIGVETNGSWHWHDEPWLTYDRLWSIAILAANRTGQDISQEKPLCSTTLPDGERIQLCIPPATSPGIISLSIRRPPDFRPRLVVLGALFEETGAKALETMEPIAEYADRLRKAVIDRKNILIAGATGSGKTTLARALIEEIPTESRLVTIEDTPEWTAIPHRNRVALFYSKGRQSQAQGIGPEELIEASLRMRPDRVLMQELRDDAAFSYLRGVAAGHPGCITTLHAGSAKGAFEALRLMIKGDPAGAALSDQDITRLLETLVHIVIHCERTNNKFRVTEIYP